MKFAQVFYELIRSAFRDGFRRGRNKACKPRFDYCVGPVTFKPIENMPLTVKLTTEQQVRITLAPTTHKGKPVTLDGKPTWQVPVGNVTLQPADDGLSCLIVSADTPGQSQVLVTADADLSGEINTISDTIDVEVSDPQASSLGLTAGTPEDKP